MSGSTDKAEIARAFSQHRFADALPHLAPDVRWTIVGYSVLEGADAVAMVEHASVQGATQSPTWSESSSSSAP